VRGHDRAPDWRGRDAELSARPFVSAVALLRILAWNRTGERAARLSAELGANNHFAELSTYRAEADIVICSTAADPYSLRKIWRARRSASDAIALRFFIDISVPRNVDRGLATFPMSLGLI